VIFPAIIDSRPAYMGGAGSLLLAHVGAKTLLEHVAVRLGRLSDAPPVVVSPFTGEAGHVDALRAAHPGLRGVIGMPELRDWLGSFEPSDFLLFIDPRCLPADGFEDELILRHPGVDPRWARHLVALDLSASGTRERLEIDTGGRVRRIQRHYEAVTWPFSSGVACSLLPVTCGLVVEDANFDSLAALRRALNAAGVPSRDLPLQGMAIDLSEERGLLQLTERLVLEASDGRPGAAGPVLVGERHSIDPSARLVGPLVLHADVEIGPDAVVLGPAVLGPGARVGAGALVAQGLLAAGIEVPPRWTLRHRAVFEPLPEGPPALRECGPPVYQGADAPLQPSPGAHHGAAQAAPQRTYARVKPVLEAVIATVALVLLSPILLLVALLVRLESRGPALYGHKREGKDGRPFHCWKFRSMYQGAEAQQRALAATNQVDGPQFKMDRDPRITRLGRWLRPTSIDELPQLINVALGQMSLVGPRPSPFRENQLCVPWREGRLSVRPGITGLWQVCRRDRHEGDFHQWIQFDLLYVRHASLWVDIKIILATLWTGGGKTNVPLEWILPAEALPSSRVIEHHRRDDDTLMLRAS